MQVANAIGVICTLPRVTTAPNQQFRRDRLAALLAHADFKGNKTALAAALDYATGAYIRQMIEGERPVSEKLIAKIEAIKGGKYRGWFTAAGDASDEAAALAAYRALSGNPVLRAKAVAYLQGLADQAAPLGEFSPSQDDHGPTSAAAA